MTLLFFRLLLFLFVFTLEVRVRAEVSPASTSGVLLQEPAGCLRELVKAKTSCALGTGRAGKVTLKLDSFEAVFDRRTAVIHQTGGDLRFVSGQIWLKTKIPQKIHTEFGAIDLGPGEFWLDRSAERVRVGVIRGLAKLHPRGSAEVLEVPPGLENWLGTVALNGEARRGLPVSIALKPHFERWARLYPGSFKDFEKEALLFHDGWLEASRYSAEIHKALFERKIASLQAEHEKKEWARRKSEVRTRELIQMFRKKLFEP